MEKTRRDSGLEVTPSQILVTNGGKQAIAHAFAVLCDPGDEVLVPAPYWTTYPEAIALAGGVPVVIAHRRVERVPGLRRPARGGPDPEDQGAPLRLALEPDRRRVPARARSRPSAGGRWNTASGWSPTRSTSTSPTAGSTTTRCPSSFPSWLTAASWSTAWPRPTAMTGWRVGWLIGPTDVVTAATNLQSHETSNVANVSQRAALAAVSGDLAAVAEMRDGLRPPPADDPPDAERDRRRSPASSPAAPSTPSRR